MGLQCRLTLACVAVLALHIPVSFAQQPSPPANPMHELDLQLSRVMQYGSLNQDTQQHKETIAWLEGLRSAPSRTQLAASKLMADCQLHDEPAEFAKAYPNLILEDVQNEYAVKLALCELAGAQFDYTAPPKCSAFLPSVEACVKRSWLWGRSEPSNDMLCYPETTKADLTRCITKLRSEPQAWTSYVTARSRATDMCHLSREHIERERALQLYKNFTVVASKLQASVYDSTERLQAMENDMQNYFDESRRFWAQSRQSAEESKLFAEEALQQAQGGLYETKQGIIAVQKEVGALQQQAIADQAALNAAFDSQIKASLARAMATVSHGQMDALEKISMDLATFYQAFMKERSELLARVNSELQDYHEKALLSIQLQHETTIRSFDTIQTELDIAKHKVGDLNERVGILGDTTDRSLAKLETVENRMDNLGSQLQLFERLSATLEIVFSAFFGVGGVALGLILFGVCFPTVYFVGKTFRRLVPIALALLSCGAIYTMSLSSANPIKLSILSETVAKVKHAEQKFWWMAIIVCIFLIAFLSKANLPFSNLFGCMPSPPSIIASRWGLSRRRVQTKDQVSHMKTVEQVVPFRQTITESPFDLEDQTWALSAQEDKELLARLNNFQRASTVC